MLMFVWVLALGQAMIPTPQQMMETQAEALRCFNRAADDFTDMTRPLMALGWVDEVDAPIF